MVIAKVTVSGAIARATYKSKIPQGIVGATVEFDYADPMWAGLKKTVIFWSSAVKDILDVGESVVVPPEVVAKAGCRLRVGIYGVDLSGKMVIPTLWADLGPVMSSANPGLDSSGNNDLNLAQLQAQIGDLAELQTETKESIVAAINELAKTHGVDLSGVVRFVNGVSPDKTGNVTISVAGGVTDAQIAKAVTDYFAKNPVTGGLTKAEKDLILSLFRNAAYTSANMGGTLAQLEALWSSNNGGETPEPDVPVTLTSISAVYSGGDVPVGTAVSDLSGIVVTAHYSDGTSKAVTGYTLSGTIAEGSNTITVGYGGKTVTFIVVGVANEPEEPEVTLTRISAVYSGGDVAVGTSVNDLTGIVVTAHYSDSTSKIVTGYTLSGTIAEGNNTVTVTYGGKTTSFTVTGVAVETTFVHEWDFTSSLVDTVDGVSAVTLNGSAVQNSDGIFITSTNDYVQFPIAFEDGYTYEFDMGNMDYSRTNNGRFIMWRPDDSGLIFKSGTYWDLWSGSWKGATDENGSKYNDKYMFANKTVKLVMSEHITQNTRSKFSIYLDDKFLMDIAVADNYVGELFTVGAASDAFCSMNIKAARVYKG